MLNRARVRALVTILYSTVDEDDERYARASRRCRLSKPLAMDLYYLTTLTWSKPDDCSR